VIHGVFRGASRSSRSRLFMGGRHGRACHNLAPGLQTSSSRFSIALVAMASAVGGHRAAAQRAWAALAIGWGTTALGPAGVRLPRLGPSLGPIDVRAPASVNSVIPRRPRYGRRPRQGVGVAKKYQASGHGSGRPADEVSRVYGRDAADAKLLTRTARFPLLPRPPGPKPHDHPALSRSRTRGVCHLAGGRGPGVAVPDLVEAGTAGSIPRRACWSTAGRPALLLSEADAGPGK